MTGNKDATSYTILDLLFSSLRLMHSLVGHPVGRPMFTSVLPGLRRRQSVVCRPTQLICLEGDFQSRQGMCMAKTGYRSREMETRATGWATVEQYSD